MTPDAEGAKAFYDASSAGISAKAPPEYQGYRMINAPTAASPAACCRLTAEMQAARRRARLARLLSRRATSMQAVEAIEAAGGKSLMARSGHSQCRADRDGDRSAGRAFLHHEADPARRQPRRGERRLLARRALAAAAGTSCRPATPTRPAASTATQFGWGERRVHGYGRDGQLPLLRPRRPPDRRADRRKQRPTAAWRYYFRVPSIDAAKAHRRSRTAARSIWARTRSRAATGWSSAPTRRARSSRSSAGK